MTVGVSRMKCKSLRHEQINEPLSVVRGLNDDVIPLWRQSIEDYIWIIRQLPLEYYLATLVADS
jgi:hypothetical protein